MFANELTATCTSNYIQLYLSTTYHKPIAATTLLLMLLMAFLLFMLFWQRRKSNRYIKREGDNDQYI